MKRILQRFFIWCAVRCGWDWDASYVKEARLVVEEVERQKNVSGEYKRREALRCLLNIFPQATESDLMFAIEVAHRHPR